MTAPTSPGVVPADVRELVERLRRMSNDTHFVWGTAYQDRAARDMGRAADMLERLANRPSLTEDDREQVRREAMLQAAEVCDVAMDIEDVAAMREGLEDWEVFNHRHAERTARAIGNRLRALADRSELRQEKEGDRG